MIGGPIGKAIGEAYPYNAATIYDQSVTANVSASVNLASSAGKIVTALVDVAATLGNFSVGKSVTANVNATVSVVKGISYTVTAALVDATTTVTKSVGKIVTPASVTAAVGTIVKSAGKTVTASVDLSVSVSRAISITLTAALVSLTAIISTLRRHPGKPLMSKLTSGKRSYWRGTR